VAEPDGNIDTVGSDLNGVCVCVFVCVCVCVLTVDSPMSARAETGQLQSDSHVAEVRSWLKL